MFRICHLLLPVLLLGTVAAQQLKKPVDSSSCHAFIDYENIWTIEIVRTQSAAAVPILNIITFTTGEWDLRTDQVHVFDKEGSEAEVKRFSIDTGVADDPYNTKYLKVLGNSFIGVDVLGKFEGFEESPRVAIDLGNLRFELKPLDCMLFERIVGQINKINFNSPDIQEDFEILRIEHQGRKVPRPKAGYW